MGTLGLRRYLYSSSLWRICSLAEVPGGVYSPRTDEQSSPALLRSSHRPSRTPETSSARPSAQSSVARKRQKINERHWRFMACGILKMSVSEKEILPVFAPRSSAAGLPTLAALVVFWLHPPTAEVYEARDLRESASRPSINVGDMSCWKHHSPRTVFELGLGLG